VLAFAGCSVLASGVFCARVIPSWTRVETIAYLILLSGSFLGAVGMFAGSTRRVIVLGLLLVPVYWGLLAAFVLVKLGFGFYDAVAHPVGGDEAYGIYQVEEYCAPPDTSTECGTYSLAIYRRVAWTPFLAHVATYNCVFRDAPGSDGVTLTPEQCMDWSTVPAPLYFPRR
jgi:hypothetical protein